MATASAAWAETGNQQSTESVVVEDVVITEQLPSEVRSGSIKVKDNDDAILERQAVISARKAIEIATTVSMAN